MRSLTQPRTAWIPRATAVWRLAPQLTTLAAAATHFVLFAYVVISRFDYKWELDWLSGSILDHIERLEKGGLAAVYTAPSVDWISFPYPPLHYWLGSQVMKVIPGYQGLRLLSILLTLVIAGCVWRLSRSQGASRFWAAIAAGLFFAGYGLTDTWYDVERCDMLTLAFLGVGTIVLIETTSLLWTVVAGALFGLAFLSKQPALMSIVFVVGGLALLRQFKRAVVFGITSAVVVVPALLFINARSNGWFFFYSFKMMRAHGVEWRLLYGVLTWDFARPWLLSIATLAILGAQLRKPTIFGAMLAAGLVAAVWSRIHIGGWANVLIFWIPFACVAVAMLGAQIESALANSSFASRAQLLMCGVVVAQFALLMYDPENRIPDDNRGEWASKFEDKVHQLERDGEVLVVGRSHVSTRRHYHHSALFDILRIPGQKIPDDYFQAIRDHRFTAIVIDGIWEFEMYGTQADTTDFQKLLVENYAITERWDDRDPPCVLGFPAHPELILRPRAQPLPDLGLAQLKQRWMVESGEAEARARALQVWPYFPPRKKS